MGGTKILACAVNSQKGIIGRLKKPTKLGASPASYVKSLADITMDLVKRLHLKEEDISAVCLGVPGAANPFTGKIAFAPNLGIRNLMIKDKLKALIPFPVLIENDVNLGALGIKRFGIGKKSRNMLVVFVGTGIGGAILIDGKIYRGSNFVAGEIGHIIVEKDGPVCGCGKRGCFEAVASRTAIARNIEKDIRAGKKSIISKLVKSGERIKSGALAKAIREKDKVVVKHISQACETIGRVLASVSNLMNFDTIVLGGGLIEALEHFMLPIIKASFFENVMAETGKGVKILAARLGDEAAIYGGIALAEEFLNIKV
jgi:glucokinase